MRPVLLWTPQAREDLLDIYVTIGFDNPSAAERLYTAMEEKATLLVSYPRMGVRRPEIAPAARMLVEGVYLLLYETHRILTMHPSRLWRLCAWFMDTGIWQVSSRGSHRESVHHEFDGVQCRVEFI